MLLFSDSFHMKYHAWWAGQETVNQFCLFEREYFTFIWHWDDVQSLITAVVTHLCTHTYGGVSHLFEEAQELLTLPTLSLCPQVKCFALFSLSVLSLPYCLCSFIALLLDIHRSASFSPSCPSAPASESKHWVCNCSLWPSVFVVIALTITNCVSAVPNQQLLSKVNWRQTRDAG